MPAAPRLIINLDEDDQAEPPSSIEQHLRSMRQSGRAPPITIHDSEDDDDVLEAEVAEVINLDEELSSCESPASPSFPRNPRINSWLLLPSLRHKHLSIREGTVVQVPPRPAELFWEFLEVRQIYRKDNVLTLRGIPLTRQRHLKGILSRSLNEVCALVEVEKDDTREWAVQAAVEVPVTEAIRTRELRKTNAPFPAYRLDVSLYESIPSIENRAPLVQRWILVTFFKTAKSRRDRKSISGIIRRLREDEIRNPCLRVSDSGLRDAWRGGGGRGTSGQPYTAGDFFCGAGGASQGMREAGFKVAVACDMDPTACKTYHANFPGTELSRTQVHEFVSATHSRAISKQYTDVLHISPPCQTWSPAHTRAGPNDEANIAALFSCGDILGVKRPRITTGEQTFGILFGRWETFFNALVHQYTWLGYSFEWDILDFSSYGLAQPRRRAIWIASCPGERLPPFPAPTHGDGPGLRGRVTISQTLETIGPRATLHDPWEALARAAQLGSFPRPAYSAHSPLPHTITTHAAENYHPSGRRAFTPREFAVLQGFPSNYHFEGNKTQVLRQIGNAFPPTVVAVLYRHIRSWLLGQDGVVEEISDEEDLMVVDPEVREVVIIDVDDGNIIARFADRRDARREAIVIDDASEHDDDNDNDNDDDDDDATMTFSRASSCTLSVESDQDMEID